MVSEKMSMFIGISGRLRVTFQASPVAGLGKLGYGRLSSPLFRIRHGLDLPPRRPCRSGHRRFARTGSRLRTRSEEHTSELQSLMRISYAVFCLKKKPHAEF